MMSDPLRPGATIGILGGGQLGRMLSVAASRLGYRCHVYEPGAAPAGDVAHAVTTAPYEDEAAIRAKVAELMVPEYEYGKFAGWIAPPQTGINDKPVEFDYVHLAEEGLV